MNILMLGWEFPPFFAGGVGIVCYELTKALSKFENIKINYIMPYGPEEKILNDKFKISCANSKKLIGKTFLQNSIQIKKVQGAMYAYDSIQSYETRIKHTLKERTLISKDKSIAQIYGSNLLEEVYLYAQRVTNLCENDDFDIIHAHDWTTFPAAIMLGKITKKPIIIHVHITELDKTGGHGGDSRVFEIEKEGFLNADKIIAVSNFTKNRIVNDYKIDPNKIEVVHNGGISDSNSKPKNLEKINQNKTILFAGRMTLQKGPEYFIRAAKLVLKYEPKTKFIMMGSGDQLDTIIQLSRELGIYKNFEFLGRYSREDANYYFEKADLFVMPSVSEPFGIVPLEAIAKGTPVIISKQSGISEVLDNSFKVDFWDVSEIANKILGIIKYEDLSKNLSENSFKEFKKFNWEIPAKKIVNIYNKMI